MDFAGLAWAQGTIEARTIANSWLKRLDAVRDLGGRHQRGSLDIIKHSTGAWMFVAFIAQLFQITAFGMDRLLFARLSDERSRMNSGGASSIEIHWSYGAVASYDEWVRMLQQYVLSESLELH